MAALSELVHRRKSTTGFCIHVSGSAFTNSVTPYLKRLIGGGGGKCEGFKLAMHDHSLF